MKKVVHSWSLKFFLGKFSNLIVVVCLYVLSFSISIHLTDVSKADVMIESLLPLIMSSNSCHKVSTLYMCCSVYSVHFKLGIFKRL